MYDTFASDLEKANQEESTAQMGFEEVIAKKTAKVKTLEGMVTDKSAQKAEKSTQLAEDEEFFETARKTCKEKSDSWDERGRLRTEELDGINKALEILTSDDARATFGAATGTRPVDTFGSEGVDVFFLQTEQEMNRSPPAKAYKALKEAISATKSLRLVRLAASVRTATKGHFDDVIAEIDTMLQTLKDEEAEDIKQRDWCIEERDTERNNRDDLLYDIKQLEEEKDATEEAKEDLLDDMAQAKADREEENANFIAAKEDDEKAIALLQDATAAMSTYGDNNLALLQKRRQPVFEVSEDQAPDATFSSSDKHKGATDGIVSLL